MRVTDAAVAEAMKYSGFINLLRDHVPPENCLEVLSALSCDRPGKREVRIIKDLINGLDEKHWRKLMEFVDFYGTCYTYELSSHRSPSELVNFLDIARVAGARTALQIIAMAWAGGQRLARINGQTISPDGVERNDNYVVMYKHYVSRGRYHGDWVYEVIIGKPRSVKTRGNRRLGIGNHANFRGADFRVDHIIWAYRIVTDPAECASIPAPELGVRAKEILAKYAPSAAASV